LESGGRLNARPRFVNVAMKKFYACENFKRLAVYAWNSILQSAGSSKHFPSERLVLTSECGFGHVPRAKLRALVEACKVL